MTINRRKKNVKQRGRNSHGWGSKKKHRGAGHRGGRGMAGTGKRADQKKQSIIVEIGLNTYFGKHGFRRRGGIPKPEIINLEQIQNHLEKWTKEGKIKDNTLNLTELGYGKLLSKGNLKTKLKIVVKETSNSALEKIKKIGGEVVAS